MMSVPSTPSAAESTTTVVIGSGLSGLAVASELSRQGVAAIVVDGLDFLDAAAPGRRPDAADAGAIGERAEILRLLRRYAQTHHLDVRNSTRAVDLSMAAGNAGGPSRPGKWIIRTADGVLMADNIVLTRCAQNQLRRILTSLGIKISRDFMNALRALGLYLVGVGDLVTPSTKEILHQAKVVSQAISVRNGAGAMRALA
ncbi:MAG TPA: FAD-binding protein [Micrococcaceae bacterium]|jgi:hypothetical protein|nr:FAD-binding protein [Micrococcaceae bacterium]